MKKTTKILSLIMCIIMIFSLDLKINAIVQPTKEITVHLIDSTGKGIADANVSYQIASWSNVGNTDTNGFAHFLVPESTQDVRVRVKYAGASYDIKQNVGVNPIFLFQTKDTIIKLVDSNGNPLSGGTVKYCYSSWFSYGTTDINGEAHKELLPAKYTVRMEYAGARLDKKIDSTLDATLTFQTKDTIIKLIDSNGNPLSSGTVKYCYSSWFSYGTTDINGEAHKELLPAKYTVRMEYAGAKLDKKIDSTINNELSFQTNKVTIKVKDFNSNPISGIKTKYCWSSWYDYGITNTEGETYKELLPSTYTFRAYLPDGYKDIKQDISLNPTIEYSISAPIVKYSLNTCVSPSSSGTITKSPNKSTYSQGEAVELSCTPVDGYEFVKWSGTNASEINNNTIIMNGNKSITAEFTKIETPPVEDPTDPTVPEDPIAPVNPDIILVTNVNELMATEISTKEGNKTVLIADGEYIIPHGLYLTGNNITYKSQSGNRDSVVIKGNFKTSHIFQIINDNVTIENLSIGEVNNHGIQVHSETDADNTIIKNVRFFDIKEQMLKGSGAKTEIYSNNCLVENCLFEFTNGIAYQYYTGGIDVHKGDSWIVRNNTFKNIISPTSSLSEGAIHFWSDSKNTLIENNIIINCDRGIMLGLDNSYHYNGVIKNNTIHVVKDTGIYLANATNTKVYNNTIFVDSNYPNAIEYRFEGTNNTSIINNLTNKSITSRDNGTATLLNNITNATDNWFKDPYNGDLHLKSIIYCVINKGIDLDEVTNDIDFETREIGSIDIGADEYANTVNSAPKSLLLEVNKNQIVSNNQDAITFSTKGIFENNYTETIIPDSINYTDSNGKTYTLSNNTFTSFVPGIYTFKAVSNGIYSNTLTIAVIKEDLSSSRVNNITVTHNKGQTFITWKEINTIIPNENITYKELYNIKNSYSRKITYNIYYSPNPIEQVNDLTPIASVPNLSCWSLDFYGISTKNTEKPAIRYTIANGGTPLANGTGLYVNNSDFAGNAYYAVTVSVDGIEDKTITTDNSITTPVIETLGQGVPVLQRIEKPASFQYIKNATLYYYTRWEAPPNCSIEGKPFDYLVAVPQNVANPAPVGIHMHCWGCNLEGGYGWWNDAEDGSILLSSNQLPYDWWTGYHEKLFTNEALKTESDWQDGIVRPYTTTRLFSFLDWMEKEGNYNIDKSRTFTAGSSMGGSGSIMAGIRYGDDIAWTRSWVGVHNPIESPNFKSSYQLCYGKPEYNVLFEDGTPVWDYYNDIWYLNQYPKKETPFITFSNGKNDSAIGWKQAVDFYKALQETKRPHLFIWGQSGHSQRTVMPLNGSERIMPIDIRVDQSLPAFTRCSLDDIPGNGDPNDGDATGQINKYLYWETNDITDTASKWEMTVGLIASAPKDSCLVDVTPRRLQNFVATPFAEYHWINKDFETGEIIASGIVIADKNGLITLEQITVSKSKNRIVIE